MRNDTHGRVPSIVVVSEGSDTRPDQSEGGASERIVFHDCHECPRAGFFHGSACWALQLLEDATENQT